MRNDQSGAPSFLLVSSLRIEINPHHVSAVRHVARHLPDFATDRPAEIDLSMSIGRRHFSYQRGERVRATLGKWRENQISIGNAYLDARTAPDVRLARDMTRDPHSKTVSPLLNHCFHVSTL